MYMHSSGHPCSQSPIPSPSVNDLLFPVQYIHYHSIKHLLGMSVTSVLYIHQYTICDTLPLSSLLHVEMSEITANLKILMIQTQPQYQITILTMEVPAPQSW
jgi:hypothetical protein